MRVVGALYGAWGLDRYGATPVRVDRLLHLAAWLEELRRRWLEEAARAGAMYLPAAFVTFKLVAVWLVRFGACACGVLLHLVRGMILLATVGPSHGTGGKALSWVGGTTHEADSSLTDRSDE